MATSAELILTIQGKNNASAALDGAKKSASGLGSALGEVGKIAAGFVVASGIMKLGGFLVDAAQAAADDAASMAKLQQAVENTGKSYDAYAGILDEVIDKSQDLGFSDDQTRDSLSILTAQTGDAEEAVRRYALAQDLARGANIDVVTASRLLGKVTDENVNVLARYGIAAKEGMNETELFGLVQEKFGGQAAAFGASTAGQMEQVKIRMGELKETIGAALLPVITKLTDFAVTKLIPAIEAAAAKWLPMLREAFSKIGAAVQPLIERVTPFFKILVENEEAMKAVAVVIGTVLVAALGALAVAAIAALAPFAPLILAITAIGGLFAATTLLNEKFGKSTSRWALIFEDEAIPATEKLALMTRELNAVRGLERDALEATIEKVKEQIDAEYYATQATAELAREEYELLTANVELQGSFKDAATAIDDHRTAAEKLDEAYDDVKTSSSEAMDQVMRWTEVPTQEVALLNLEIEKSERATRWLEIAQREGKPISDEMIQTSKDHTQALQDEKTLLQDAAAGLAEKGIQTGILTGKIPLLTEAEAGLKVMSELAAQGINIQEGALITLIEQLGLAHDGVMDLIYAYAQMTPGAGANIEDLPGSPAYAEGTPYVPRTGLAYLHQGEAVIPAGENPYTHGGGSGGGIQVILNNAVIYATGRDDAMRSAGDMAWGLRAAVAIRGGSM